MGGHPIEYHAYPSLMELINQEHHVLRWAIPAGRCEVPRCLISPRAIEGVLHERQKLYMGEAHFARIPREIRRHLPVAEVSISILGNPPPRPKVHLVCTDRRSK